MTAPNTTMMQRGEVWWVDFDPSRGREIRKTRPAIVVSNNAANASLSRLQVVPLTSNTTRLYPSEAFVQIKGTKSKALADQLTTVSKSRFKQRLGILTNDDLKAVESAIKTQLGLQQ